MNKVNSEPTTINFENTVFGLNTGWPINTIFRNEFYVAKVFDEIVRRTFFYDRVEPKIKFADKPDHFIMLEGYLYIEDEFKVEDFAKTRDEFFNKYAVDNKKTGETDVFKLLNFIISNKKTQRWINKSIGIWFYANVIAKYMGCTRSEFDEHFNPKTYSTEYTEEVRTEISDKLKKIFIHYKVGAMGDFHVDKTRDDYWRHFRGCYQIK